MNMKCPNCKHEMEKGTLVADGTRWSSGVTATMSEIFPLGGFLVLAWKCPECNKIELVGDTKSE
jgi:hypothetical protein